MKAQVIVRLKEGVLDPQGEAVSHALNNMGYNTVGVVRQSKLIELELEDDDPVQAEIKVKEMCEKLLANTVIEKYAVERCESTASASRRLRGRGLFSLPPKLAKNIWNNSDKKVRKAIQFLNDFDKCPVSGTSFQ